MAGVAAAVVLAAVGIIVAAPARSAPYCPPGSQLSGTNPDCLFLFLVNKNVFPVQGVEDATIAKGKEACNQMSADPGPRPIVDWAVRFTAQHSEMYPPDQRVDGRAVSFAQAAAAGYCPWIQH